MDLIAGSIAGATMKPNYVFNGYGGSDRVDPFENKSDDECIVVSDNAKAETAIKPTSTSINNRLKAGGLRNVKLTK